MRNLVIVLAITVMLCAGCGGDNGSGPADPPSVPTGLSAQGGLGEIELTWAASSGGGLAGYNIYRSTDGVNFAKVNATLVVGLVYQDTDVDDGVFYSYKITAVGEAESGYSGVVRDMHGTRMLSSYNSGCVLGAGAASPYVAEDSVKIAGGHLEIQSGASLYILDSAVVNMVHEPLDPTKEIRVWGLIRVEASDSTPARITSQQIDGSPPNDGLGYRLEFYDEAIDYDPGDGSGSLIQNCYVENLMQGDAAILVDYCSPRFFNCKISSNKSTGGSYLDIKHDSAPIIENCSITKVVLKIMTELSGTEALITRNTCRGGYYTIYFFGHIGPGIVDPGQIAYNDFDGDRNGFYMNQVEAGDIPLANNYWDGGLPDIVGHAGTPVFTPMLTSPPDDCGPSW